MLVSVAAIQPLIGCVISCGLSTAGFSQCLHLAPLSSPHVLHCFPDLVSIDQQRRRASVSGSVWHPHAGEYFYLSGRARFFICHLRTRALLMGLFSLSHIYIFPVAFRRTPTGGWGGDYALRSHSSLFSTGHWLSASPAIVRLADKE